MICMVVAGKKKELHNKLLDTMFRGGKIQLISLPKRGGQHFQALPEVGLSF